MTAFERDASGTFAALEVMMKLPPEFIVGLASRPSGGEVMTFQHDRASPEDDDSDLRTLIGCGKRVGHAKEAEGARAWRCRREIRRKTTT